MALKHVYYHVRIESPVYVRCRIQHAWGWCTGMTQRDVMGREVGGAFMFGNACTPVVDSCQCMAKPIQYCKVKKKIVPGRMALKHVYYHVRIESPVLVRCRIQHAWGWCTGMTQRDVMGKEVGGGFMFGNACTPVVDSCQCMAKPIQYCKVKKK